MALINPDQKGYEVFVIEALMPEATKYSRFSFTAFDHLTKEGTDPRCGNIEEHLPAKFKRALITEGMRGVPVFNSAYLANDCADWLAMNTRSYRQRGEHSPPAIAFRVTHEVVEVTRLTYQPRRRQLTYALEKLP